MTERPEADTASFEISNGIAWVKFDRRVKQFIDNKTCKPGLGVYNLNKQEA